LPRNDLGPEPFHDFLPKIAHFDDIRAWLHSTPLAIFWTGRHVL
jgi:hypothetical protein